jgi:hypothetical protein
VARVTKIKKKKDNKIKWTDKINERYGLVSFFYSLSFSQKNKFNNNFHFQEMHLFPGKNSWFHNEKKSKPYLSRGRTVRD